MEFHKDEVKNKVVWTKGADFTDGSPRYTFEGRDPATTFERFQVVIYAERERRYAHDPGSLCNHYYGYVRDDKMECAETIGPYYSVREAKQRTLELFNLFMQQYANQDLDSATSESAVHGHDDQQKHFQYQWAVGTPQRKYADMLDKLIPAARWSHHCRVDHICGGTGRWCGNRLRAGNVFSGSCVPRDFKAVQSSCRGDGLSGDPCARQCAAEQ